MRGDDGGAGVGSGWGPDRLGPDFESATIPLRAGRGGERLVATLVRHHTTRSESPALLYVHGFNDYFFQADLARWWSAQGWTFYALDLRRCGRSLLEGQIPNACDDLGDYDEELDLAAAAIRAEGHARLLLAGHSTGGLIVTLWAARRRTLPLAGLVLNSPFFELRQPVPVRVALGRAVGLIGRRAPDRALPGGVDTLYGDSLHRSRRGEWDFDLQLKPSPSFPVRFGWLASVLAGQRTLRAGLGLDIPALVMSSTRSVAARAWTEELRSADAVLDADAIARAAPALGRNVTIVRIDGGLHDLILSPRPARDAAYAAMGRWLDAWVEPA
jgi:alpha-beta hydrolase superfamily lysophospholipase